MNHNEKKPGKSSWFTSIINRSSIYKLNIYKLRSSIERSLDNLSSFVRLQFLVRPIDHYTNHSFINNWNSLQNLKEENGIVRAEYKKVSTQKPKVRIQIKQWNLPKECNLDSWTEIRKRKLEPYAYTLRKKPPPPPPLSRWSTS